MSSFLAGSWPPPRVLFRGPYNFLAGPEEVERDFADLVKLLPTPVAVQAASREQATPVIGYLVRRTRALERLEELLLDFLRALERSHLAARRGTEGGPARADLDAAWRRYHQALVTVLDNILGSDYGRGFLQVFWLHQSNAVVRATRGSSRRLRELDAQLARERGDAVRYTLLLQFLDRLFEVVHERVDFHAERSGQDQLRQSTRLLVRMRDNVLVWTEDHVGRDLSELAGYFRGYLRVDASDLFYRFALLQRWHRELFARDAQVRAAAEHLLAAPTHDPDFLLSRPGYLSFLARHPEFSEDRFLAAREVRLWENLLGRLKEFEILNGVRRVVVEVDVDSAGRVRCDERAARRLGLAASDVMLSSDAHPLDFGAAWVFDSEIWRTGLVYDITDFSSVIARIRLADRAAQQQSFQQVFLLQHRFNRMAASLRLRREKYLGDGAFYSSRRPDRALLLALLFQRSYRAAVAEGFPFDRGMRIALNFSSYRLMPFAGSSGEAAHHEVFGHGVVELSRLVSGKRGLDLEEIIVTLKANGYGDQAVHEFFAPLLDSEVGLADRRTDGDFSARVTPQGSLVNEGIVATTAFVQQLSAQGLGPFYAIQVADRSWVALHLVDERGGRHVAGLRRLGTVDLKGLDRVGMYEVVDGQGWRLEEVLPHRDLQRALDERYSSAVASR